MGLWQAYRLRLRRRRRILRAIRKRRELFPVVNRTRSIRTGDILVFSTIRNEFSRLPHFLQYYRELGVDHFLIVDNDSRDGGREFLARQPDVSVWHTRASYRRSHFGIDWMNWLLLRYGTGHWCVTVDPDELFVYPFCDTRPIRALTDWLDEAGCRAFGAMLLDLYPKGPLEDLRFVPGQNPLDHLQWFDPGNYRMSVNPLYRNLWIQGGVRERGFFSEDPYGAPALNKIPLVKWHWRYAYVSSTHNLLPRRLNVVYDEWGGERPSGVLLHTKLLPGLQDRAREEMNRREHYAQATEYRAYAQGLARKADLWCEWSERYLGWRQLELLGLMSKGSWA